MQCSYSIKAFVGIETFETAYLQVNSSALPMRRGVTLVSQGHQGEVIGSLFPPPPPIIAHIVEHFDTDGIGNTCNIGARCQMENTKYLSTKYQHHNDNLW